MSYLLGIKKIASWIKKIFIIFIVYLGVIYLFFYFINKDKVVIKNNPIEENRKKIYQIINDPELTKNKEGRIVILIYRGMICNLIGEACANSWSSEENFKFSIAGFISNLINLPYHNPPASGVYWVSSEIQKAGFIPKAYAMEGIGFASLKPLMAIWRIFRDLTYTLLVLLLITIGFMIMFRMKLNSQTLITIENALPKIIISLILINFSFAIAGFLIDILYFSIGITVSLLTPPQEIDYGKELMGGPTSLMKEILSFNYYNAANGLLDLLPTSIKTIVNLITISASFYFFDFILFGKLLGFQRIFETIPGYGGIIGFVIRALLGFLLAPIIGPFFLAILLIFSGIFLFFRIFFILFKNYIELLIYIIFSPIILLFEAIPGKSTFSFWFKKIFFNIFIFYLVFVLLKITQNLALFLNNNSINIWQPPFLDDIGYQYFSALIALGMLLIIPDIINLSKQILGIKDGVLPFGIGVFFSGVGALVGGAQTGMATFHSFTQAPFIGPWLQEQAREDKGTLGKLLKGMIGPSQAEIFAKELQKRGIGREPQS